MEKENMQEGEGELPWAEGQEKVALRAARLELRAAQVEHRTVSDNLGLLTGRESLTTWRGGSCTAVGLPTAIEKSKGWVFHPGT